MKNIDSLKYTSGFAIVAILYLTIMVVSQGYQALKVAFVSSPFFNSFFFLLSVSFSLSFSLSSYSGSYSGSSSGSSFHSFLFSFSLSFSFSLALSLCTPVQFSRLTPLPPTPLSPCPLCTRNHPQCGSRS
jgi:hypothetical protein